MFEHLSLPQTSKKLRVRKGTRRKLSQWQRRPQRPEPTHCNGGDLFLPPWVSWYDALEDLVPTFPPSELADWHLRLLRNNPATSFLVPQEDHKPVPQDVLVEGSNGNQQWGHGGRTDDCMDMMSRSVS